MQALGMKAMLNRTTIIILSVFGLVLELLLVCWISFIGEPTNAGEWANFGTYIGGVLTPLTVLAALLALVQRDSEYRIEADRSTRQGHKIDILRFIERIESDIDALLNQITINIAVNGKQITHPCRDVLFKITFAEWERVIPTSEEILSRADQNSGIERYDEKLILFEAFSMVAAYINRLREHCVEYDRASQNNVTGLYFARKYKVASERLNKKGYEVAIWKAGAQQDASADAEKAPRC